MANLHILGSKLGECMQTAVHRLSEKKEGDPKFANAKYRCGDFFCHVICVLAAPLITAALCVAILQLFSLWLKSMYIIFHSANFVYHCVLCTVLFCAQLQVGNEACNGAVAGVLCKEQHLHNDMLHYMGWRGAVHFYAVTVCLIFVLTGVIYS